MGHYDSSYSYDVEKRLEKQKKAVTEFVSEADDTDIYYLFLITRKFEAVKDFINGLGNMMKIVDEATSWRIW